MRIAISAESFLPRTNGVANSVAQVALTLRRSGHEPLIIAPDSYRGDDFHGIPVHRVRSIEIPGVHDVDVAVTTANRMAAVLDDFDPDVVHLASPFIQGRTVLQAARALDLPTVAVYQTHVSGYANHYRLSGVSFLADSVVRGVHRNATVTLAPSRDCVDYLSGLGVEDIRLWGRGVDVSRFSPRERCASLRAQWSPRNRPIVGYVGRLAPEKGVDMLAGLAAAADLQVVIVGDGPCRADLMRALPDAVFTGRLLGRDLARAMASMDVLVAPGELETFCQVVQEGMASGVPVVAPAVGGPRDLISHGVTGLLYPPGDRAEMDRLVRSIAFDAARAADLRTAASAWVASRTWDALTDELLDHYRGVAPAARLLAA